MSFPPSVASIESALLLVLVLAVLVVVVKVLRNSFVYIPNTKYGIVERKWSTGLAGREQYAPMALGRGAGYLPEIREGGWHLLTPFAYTVHKLDRIRIDGIGYMIAKVGSPLMEGQALGAWPLAPGEALATDVDGLSGAVSTTGVNLEDARGFLVHGGQRGQQRRILRTGTYAPNLALFTIITDDAVYSLGGPTADDIKLQKLLVEIQGFVPVVIGGDNIGIVTVQDGPSLTHSEVVAPAVGTDPNQPETFHNSYQDVRKFLHAGGRRGQQERPLLDGTYYINRWFATITMDKKTTVDIGTVKVVNSYVGKDNGETLTTDNGRNRVVPYGYRGIWDTSLEAGKYSFNPLSMATEEVPTTNFQLRWIDGTVGGAIINGRSLDQDLREIPIITQDGFEILLPISIVAHISPRNAPLVIQKFSNIPRLVTQTLDPMVSAYFKDVAQAFTLLGFIGKRKEMQEAALEAMKTRLGVHHVEVEDVLIGTPRAMPGDDRMELVFNQLRNRQVAIEEQLTFKAQAETAVKRRDLAEAQAKAEQQSDVTRSELSIVIATNSGKAEAARQKEAAEGIVSRANAEAEAARIRVAAVEGVENYLQQLAIETLGDALKKTTGALVPTTLVEGAGGGSSNVMGALLAMATGATKSAPVKN